MYVHSKSPIRFAFQVHNKSIITGSKGDEKDLREHIASLESRISSLQKELDEREVEVSKLRTEADMNAKRILFLSHYATSMRHESPQARKSAKRRLSDLTDRERRLYRRVSEECNKLVTEKVDPEQLMSEDLRSNFRDACADLERSNQEMLDKFKSDFIELKERLFSSIHSTAPGLDS